MFHPTHFHVEDGSQVMAVEYGPFTVENENGDRWVPITPENWKPIDEVTLNDDGTVPMGEYGAPRRKVEELESLIEQGRTLIASRDRKIGELETRVIELERLEENFRGLNNNQYDTIVRLEREKDELADRVQDTVSAARMNEEIAVYKRDIGIMNDILNAAAIQYDLCSQYQVTLDEINSQVSAFQLVGCPKTWRGYITVQVNVDAVTEGEADALIRQAARQIEESYTNSPADEWEMYDASADVSNTTRV